MKNFFKNLFNKNTLGLLELSEDKRDFDLGIFGLGEYKPKNKRKVLDMLSVKTQTRNSCGWSSITVGKERDEKVKLSVRFIVALGLKYGFIKGDGYSNLRGNEVILQKYGTCEESMLTGEGNKLNWNEYSNSRVLTNNRLDNAKKHRSKSFWRIRTLSQMYKLIDENRGFRIGSRWSRYFNMGGGFRKPFILNFKRGGFVGGHAIFAKGYDTDYQGNRVFILHNSFGSRYGENGTFYIKEGDLLNEISRFGAYTNLDYEIDIAKWINEYNGKLVKELNGNKVYLIKEGKKHLFPDIATVLSHGYSDIDIIKDIEEMLLNIESGNDLNFWNGKDVKVIKETLKRVKDNKAFDEFKSYFKELFN